MAAFVTTTAVIQVKPGIGDTIWHLPFVRVIAAAAPGGQVTFLAPASSLASELLAAEPSIADVIYFKHGGNELQRAVNLFRLARLLRARHFQSIWILDRTTRPAAAAWLAGIPERIGFGLTAQRFWLSTPGLDRLHFHEPPISCLKELMLSRNINLTSTEPALEIPAEALEAIDARFGALPRPMLVLGIGASHPSKDWPDGHWRALLRLLTGRFAGSVVLIGGPAWRKRAERLVAESGGRAINACDLPVIQSAALLKRAALYAGPDSGPLNLAAAVGTDAFGLFGLTPPLDYSRFIHVVRADDSQAPTPMNQITPSRLMAVLAPKLEVLVR
jgi:heptosyltransferase-2